jgi:hypothetical protein
MGFQHGLFCLGCCWAIMLLSVCIRSNEPAVGRRSFGVRAGGKLAPTFISRPSGVVITVAGVWLLFQ